MKAPGNYGHVGLCSLGWDITELCMLKLGLGWVLAEGAGHLALLGCSSVKASLRHSV